MLPLRVHLVFHPGSQPARELALGLYRELHDDPNVPGLRVPIVFAPEDGSEHPPAIHELALHEARRNLVVVLADDAMVVEFGEPPAGRSTWATFAGDLFAALDRGDPSQAFFPVQVSEAAWPLDRRLEQISFERAYLQEVGEPRIDWLARRIVIRLYQMLCNKPRADQAPIELFVSHAKADLGPRSAVAGILRHLDQTQPVAAWVDSAKIPSGSDFGGRIADGIRRSSVLAVLTDNYSARPWCRREILLAKREQRPLVVVDALDQLDLRAFPYLGNVPMRRWTPEGAADCIDLILKESLRVELTRLELAGEPDQPKNPGDQILTTRPELATLVGLAHDRPILYPDPPLSDEEVELLREIHTGELTTPLQRVARNRRLADIRVALSAGESPDLGRRGLTSAHLQHALLGLCRQLLVSGATLSYGGHLDAHGYTSALLDLTLAHQAQATLPPEQRIACYLAWSGAPRSPKIVQQLARHQRAGEWTFVPRPDRVEDLDPARFVAQLTTPLKPDSAIDRYAIARSMTLMREQQTADLAARVVLGGKLGGLPDGRGWYHGLMPGILEEVLLTMKVRKPIFVIGAFGGAAGMIADVLAGRERAEMTWDHHRRAPHIVGMRELYEQRDGGFPDYPGIQASLHDRGWAGLNNGLSETENHELWYGRDLDRIVTLISAGLVATQES